jgi:APA family basic amino acid/polyamine antiporter
VRGDLILLSIGAVIGAGIFSLHRHGCGGRGAPLGEVVRYGAGPALIVSFVLLGVVCGSARSATPSWHR